jgi:flavin-dependent dehydrogenase
MVRPEIMATPRSFDAIVVGGGPAGSQSARALVKAGMRVAVLDRERFPRVKLCGGWLSPAVWDVLQLAPREYTGALWEWKRCHVQHAGRRVTLRSRGYFIRRYELDAFLLQRSGAEVIEHNVKRFERTDGRWLVDDKFSAPFVIAAGGTHCPMASHAFSRRPSALVAAQENEFLAGATAVASARVGEDGEPELLLHNDLGGYSWNVPKGEWLNVGTGTSNPREVKAAWANARDFFLESGHVPESARSALHEVKGHSYYLFDPAHLESCERDGMLVVGDALGLAHPLTAEGILPAVLSGRLAGEALVAGKPSQYRTSLESHEVMRDYALAQQLLATGIALRDRFGRHAASLSPPPGFSRLGQAALARGFARLFSGAPIPWAGALRLALRGTNALTLAAGGQS